MGRLTGAAILVMLGCASPVLDSSPPPAIKDDLSIPRELGPCGDQGYPFEGRIDPESFTGFRRNIEVRCRTWKHEGSIYFAQVWRILSNPAQTPEDLLHKVAFVRFGIPNWGFGAEFEGGTEELLRAIFQSGQHECVRLAALAALRGLHVEVGVDPRRCFVYLTSKEARWCGACPEAVSPDGSPVFAAMATDLLKPPVSERKTWDFISILNCFWLEDVDLPAGFEALVEPVAEHLIAWGRKAFFLTGSLMARNPGPRSKLVLMELLKRKHHASSSSIELVLHWMGDESMTENVRESLRTLERELEGEKDNPDYAKVLNTIRRRLKTSDTLRK